MRYFQAFECHFGMKTTQLSFLPMKFYYFFVSQISFTKPFFHIYKTVNSSVMSSTSKLFANRNTSIKNSKSLVASNIHHFSFCCRSLHSFVQPVSQSLEVPLKPADVFLNVFQGDLGSSQLRRLFFDRLKEQLHLKVKDTSIYKNTQD